MMTWLYQICFVPPLKPMLYPCTLLLVSRLILLCGSFLYEFRAVLVSTGFSRCNLWVLVCNFLPRLSFAPSPSHVVFWLFTRTAFFLCVCVIYLIDCYRCILYSFMWRGWEERQVLLGTNTLATSYRSERHKIAATSSWRWEAGSQSPLAWGN